VTAEIVTTRHGVLTRQITVSGYGAVMTLTFDDGHKTVLTDAVPLLESYGLTATAYIVPAWTSLDPDEYMTWDDIALVQEAGWEIGSHSMTHPDLTEVDPYDLDWEIGQSQAELRSRGFPADSFSLPHEAYDETVMNVVERYYESCKTDRGINPAPDQTDPLMIKSQTALSWRPFSYYQAHIDSVLETGGWYVLNNHVVRDDCQGGSWCVTAARLAEVIEYALENRVKIATVRAVLGRRDGGIPLGEDDMYADVPAGPGGGDGPAVDVLSAPGLVRHGPAEIRYRLSAPARLDIGVYDVMGRRVSSLVGPASGAGEHAVSWNGLSAVGAPVASGQYFVVFTLEGDLAATVRVTVLR